MYLFARSLLVAVLAFVVASCNRDQAPTVKTTDSVSTSVTVPVPATPTDTLHPSVPVAAAPPVKSNGAPNNAAASPSAPDSFKIGVLPDSDPIAKKLLESMRGRSPMSRKPGMVSAANVVPSTTLAQLQPKIPGYELASGPSNFDGQGQSRSTALLKNAIDPTRTIRVIIKSEDESMGSSYEQTVNQLKQSGSLTDYGQGEPITAYYLQVGGMPAAKAYIPSKHVATLTVFVGGHRLIQLREDKVNSSDHLVEVSKYLDVKRLESLAAQP